MSKHCPLCLAADGIPFFVIAVNEVPRDGGQPSQQWAPFRGITVPHATQNHSNKLVVFVDYRYRFGAAIFFLFVLSFHSYKWDVNYFLYWYFDT